MTERGETPGGGAGAGPHRRLTTILAADLCGYSALSEADPQRALALVAEATALIAAAAEAGGGRLFHRAGDGFLCELPSATAGVEAAARIQRRMRRRADRACLRIGVHTGEVTEEASGDLLGHAVNVAARLQSEAPDGGTLISAATRALCEAPVPLRRVGTLKLRNMREPVTAFEVVTNGGVAARLRVLLRTGWLRRNQAAALTTGAVLLVAALAVTASFASRDRAVRAERAAEARTAELAAEAATLADLLTEEEARLLDREAVEEAALSLLSSTDRAKAEARAAALGGDVLAAAEALRRAYEAQAAEGAPPAALAETAAQCGAFAFGRDQALAQWAYERAYDAMPREPFVLLRLAGIAVDRNRDEDARSYLSALLAADSGADYEIEANSALAFLALRRRDHAEAERRLRVALATARATDSARSEARVLTDLAGVAVFRASEAVDVAARDALYEAADADLERALRIFRALRDGEGTIGTLKELARLSHMQDKLDEARTRYEEVYLLVADTDDLPALSSVAFNLAGLLGSQGDVEGRDRYWHVAYDAAAAGNVDSMLPILHAMRAGHAHGDGLNELACRERGLALNAGSEGDVKVMLASMAPDLECHQAATLTTP